mmetsp:Transcript_8299/g.21797  ORF Transcript_8299/g.21797 Transcript_8299/m.21797 type:complete len:203 (-) Transcript_8299:41-649(-)
MSRKACYSRRLENGVHVLRGGVRNDPIRKHVAQKPAPQNDHLRRRVRILQAFEHIPKHGPVALPEDVARAPGIRERQSAHIQRRKHVLHGPLHDALHNGALSVGHDNRWARGRLRKLRKHGFQQKGELGAGKPFRTDNRVELLELGSDFRHLVRGFENERTDTVWDVFGGESWRGCGRGWGRRSRAAVRPVSCLSEWTAVRG